MGKTAKKIVLTAPNNDLSESYNNPIYPFFFGAISKYAFGGLLNLISFPPVENNENGMVKLAPYGLRKIEAALIAAGFDENDIAVCHPNNLQKFVDKDITKVVGIHAMNTLGFTYCDLTFSAIVGFGTDTVNAFEFRKLMFNPALIKNRPKIILGGAGAWQVNNDYCRKYFNLDSIVLGEGEMVVPDLFRKAINGEALPKLVTGIPPDADSIPEIKHACIYGNVEISRGCGRNCKFCSPTKRIRRDIPLSKIIHEIRTNLKERKIQAKLNHQKSNLEAEQEGMIFLTSEDLLLYGCDNKKFIPNEEAILDLLEAMVHEGVSIIQPSHLSLAATAAKPELLQRIYELLSYEANGEKQIRGFVEYKGKRYIGVETGAETGSPRIIQKIMPGKSLPFKPEQWQDIIIQAYGILNDNFFFPFTSFMIGNPEETEDDAMKTLELLDQIRHPKYNSFLIPVFFTPLGDCFLRNRKSANLASCTPAHEEIFVKCWESNVETYKHSFFTGAKKIILPLLGGFLYMLYYRWREKHDMFEKILTKIAGIRK